MVWGHVGKGGAKRTSLRGVESGIPNDIAKRRRQNETPGYLLVTLVNLHCNATKDSPEMRESADNFNFQLFSLKDDLSAEASSDEESNRE